MPESIHFQMPRPGMPAGIWLAVTSPGPSRIWDWIASRVRKASVAPMFDFAWPSTIVSHPPYPATASAQRRGRRCLSPPDLPQALLSKQSVR